MNSNQMCQVSDKFMLSKGNPKKVKEKQKQKKQFRVEVVESRPHQIGQRQLIQPRSFKHLELLSKSHINPNFSKNYA